MPVPGVQRKAWKSVVPVRWDRPTTVPAELMPEPSL